ncbi:MAG: hypothetical protein HZB42_00985 [Sphingobacteriales bacterium]|nr:hypothetical protein [Sphingobacteriales bacterium]
MADNPRFPDHHSDIPSSRHTGGAPNPASPSQSNPYNPQPQNTAPPAKTHLRNVLIGAVVTVFTSTVVFLITQYLKKPEGSEFIRKKEATTAVWKSYIAYENAYTRNILSFQKTGQLEGREAYLKGVKKESEKFQKDILDLQKRKYIDEDLIKTFNKRLENEKNSVPLVEEFYKKLTEIEGSNKSIKEKKETITNEMIHWTITSNGMYERSTNEIKEIAKVLEDRYGGSFSMNDFLLIQMAPQLMKTNDSMIRVLQNVVMDSSGNIIENRNFASNVDPENLVGKWTVEGAVITLSKNRKMTWVVANGSKAEGTWKIENDQLKIQATTSPENKKVQWLFNLANITLNSFTMVFDGAPYNLYKLTRTLEN